jgi:hypothetical protein
LLCAALVLSSASRAAEPAGVEVLVLGTFHMSNPGRDLHNMKVEDVLAPGPQAQIAAAVRGLARFAPTLVAVEWDAPVVAERYPKYLDGTLAPSRNEVVQLGFRLAKLAKSPIEGIDVEGDFPWPPLAAWAEAHGRKAELDAIGVKVDEDLRVREKLLAENGVVATLRSMNEPAQIQLGGEFYRRLLQYGAGKEQPGVELLTAWYHRNFAICAALAQRAKPGVRIAVIYGAGHSFLLRQCVQEMPGWRLIEANAYLPLH